ncbi:MAG: aminotransferase class IV [Paludibacter sp.]|nr:aminotransferase class IV [Paludibacter sp.]
MCRFFESIKLQDGVFYRLELHQERVNKTFKTHFPDKKPIDLVKNIYLSTIPQTGIYKCRIVYDSSVQSLEYTPYVRREIRSLKLVDTDMESKAYKMEDRTGLNAVFAQRGDCDDVLLVKNGFLTDTSYSNIALFDGKQWFTPRTPLLYGVNRAGLLTEGKIIEKDIKTEELMNFQSLTLFNALIEFGDIILDISVINR